MIMMIRTHSAGASRWRWLPPHLIGLLFGRWFHQRGFVLKIEREGRRLVCKLGFPFFFSHLKISCEFTWIYVNWFQEAGKSRRQSQLAQLGGGGGKGTVTHANEFRHFAPFLLLAGKRNKIHIIQMSNATEQKKEKEIYIKKNKSRMIAGGGEIELYKLMSMGHPQEGVHRERVSTHRG